MSTSQDYKTLGLTPQASPEEVKNAYRMLTLKWHPDKNPNDKVAAERFRKIVEAYDAISNPQPVNEGPIPIPDWLSTILEKTSDKKIRKDVVEIFGGDENKADALQSALRIFLDISKGK